MLLNSEFQISTLGAKGGIGEKNGKPANVDTLTVDASATRLFENQTVISHTHKNSPLSSLKPNSKQAFVVLT